MLAFSNDYYGMIFRATQSVELFCAYVPVDYILRKDEEEQQREQDNKREIMELYRDMDQYNRDTWIIIGKRLLGGQLHKYNEDSIIEKRLKE